MGRQLHPTRNSTSTVTLSYFQHEVLGVCVCVCVWRGGPKKPPVASISRSSSSFSFLANRFKLASLVAFMFPAVPSPPFSLSGLPQEAEPACDIVCHWRITALARCHEHAEDTEEVTSSARVPFCHGLRSRRRAKQLHAGKKQTNN